LQNIFCPLLGLEDFTATARRQSLTAFAKVTQKNRGIAAAIENPEDHNFPAENLIIDSEWEASSESPVKTDLSGMNPSRGFESSNVRGEAFENSMAQTGGAFLVEFCGSQKVVTGGL
jgi:hypothetical protein